MVNTMIEIWNDHIYELISKLIIFKEKNSQTLLETIPKMLGRYELTQAQIHISTQASKDTLQFTQ